MTDLIDFVAGLRRIVCGLMEKELRPLVRQEIRRQLADLIGKENDRA